MQVIVDSTRGGAMAMGVENLTGTLEKGKAADLVVLSADPTANIANSRRLRWVMRAGVMRSIQELSEAASR